MFIECTLSGNRIFCLSDLHINAERLDFFKGLLKNLEADAILLLGDISDQGETHLVIDELQKGLKIPIYYVMGNHDFYGQWIDLVRNKAKSENYLTKRSEPIYLSSSTCLIGHDGWADGREGDFFTSKIIVRDSFEIMDFKGRSIAERFEKINELADESVEHMQEQLQHAKQAGVETVFIATHVPPFIEACLWEGEIADKNWAPHFASKAMGDMLRAFFLENRHMKGEVLAGHTHTRAHVQILPNLEIFVLQPGDQT